MATLTEITEAVAAQLRSQIDDVYVHDAWKGDTQVPALIVMPPVIPEYHETFSAASGAVRSIALELWALAAPLDTGTILYAQRTMCELADYTGAKSVPAAIRQDPTLGAVVGQCLVESFDVLGAEEVSAIRYWGGRFRLRIQAAR